MGGGTYTQCIYASVCFGPTKKARFGGVVMLKDDEGGVTMM